MNSIIPIQTLLPLLGVLIGGVLTFSTQYYFLRKRDKADRRRTAALVAQDLEMLAEECAEVISSNELAWDTDGQLGKYYGNVPLFPPINKDADPRDLSPEHLSAVLALGLKERLGNRKVSFQAEFGDRGDVANEASEQCALIGYEAAQLAKTIRRKAGLLNPDYKLLHWDFEEPIRELREKALENKRQHEERSS